MTPTPVSRPIEETGRTASCHGASIRQSAEWRDSWLLNRKERKFLKRKLTEDLVVAVGEAVVGDGDELVGKEEDVEEGDVEKRGEKKAEEWVEAIVESLVRGARDGGDACSRRGRSPVSSLVEFPRQAKRSFALPSPASWKK